MTKRKTLFKSLTAIALAAVLLAGAGIFSACSFSSKEKSDDNSETQSSDGNTSGNTGSGSGSSSDGDVTVERVAFSGFDLTYEPTDTVDFGKLVIQVYYSDGSNDRVTSVEYDTDRANNSDTEAILYTDGLYGYADRVIAMGGGEIPEDTYDITCLLLENGKTYDVGTVEVTWSPSLQVVYYDDPEFLTTYKQNLERSGDEKDANGNVKSSAKDEDNDDRFITETALEDYCVGSDNVFKFEPKLTIYNTRTGEMYETLNFEAGVTVCLVNGDVETELNLDVNDYVTYENFGFYFTEEAVGKRFRISVAPAEYKENYFGRTISPVEMVVNVESGYNVYSALDLGRINLVDSSADYSGCTDTSTARAFWDTTTKTFTSYKPYQLWEDFLEEEGEDPATLKATKGIYLQTNIDITQDDIPAEFFVSEQEARDVGNYYENMIGSIRDMVYPYTHYMKSDFTINGNLFRMDCSTLKYGLTEFVNGNYKDGKWGYLKYYEDQTTVPTSQSCLFCFSGLMDSGETPAVNPESRATVYFKNVDLKGNLSNPTYKTNVKGYGMAAGSIEAVQAKSTKMVMDNCIIREFSIGVHSQYTNEGYTCSILNDSKILDCYNCGIYSWVSAKNELNNSVIRRIGGPAVMAFSKTEDEANVYGYYFDSGCDVDERSVIENYIAGDEAWFSDMNLTFIGNMLSGLDVTFKDRGRTLYSGQINENGSDTINLKYVGADNNFGTSGVNMINVNYSIAGYEFLLNQDTLITSAGATKSRSDYETDCEYLAAKINDYGGQYFLGLGNVKLVYMTNTGKAFVPDDVALGQLVGGLGGAEGTADGSTKIYSLDSVMNGGTEEVELDENDTEVFMLISLEMSGLLNVSLAIGAELYDYSQPVTTAARATVLK
ncbi:MAG: right-handed parallel beta-helix repeat-containing protein [Clostridia bacterium]|nr:right-handed parallel beta-helix repeat-containing protein [Clostridia bacterium]